jgi:hypothetical protein
VAALAVPSLVRRPAVRLVGSCCLPGSLVARVLRVRSLARRAAVAHGWPRGLPRPGVHRVVPVLSLPLLSPLARRPVPSRRGAAGLPRAIGAAARTVPRLTRRRIGCLVGPGGLPRSRVPRILSVLPLARRPSLPLVGPRGLPRSRARGSLTVLVGLGRPALPGRGPARLPGARGVLAEVHAILAAGDERHAILLTRAVLPLKVWALVGGGTVLAGRELARLVPLLSVPIASVPVGVGRTRSSAWPRLLGPRLAGPWLAGSGRRLTRISCLARPSSLTVLSVSLSVSLTARSL